MDTIELPRSFEDIEIDHMVVLIADMLQRIITHNDHVPLSPEALTRFHSRTPPSISVLEYLRRIVKYTKVEKSCLLITLHYIDQICSRRPTFMISSLTVHRFIIASIAVSSKALCDIFCTNSHYAKVGGTRVEELNLLEREFLTFIDWRLTCTRELLQAYYTNLVRTHSTGSYKILDPLSSAVSSGGSDIDSLGGESDPDEVMEDPEPTAPPTEVTDADWSSPSAAGPNGVLRRIGSESCSTNNGATLAHEGPTIEQSAAFAALRKSASPCSVEVARREKRTNSVLDPAVDTLRPRGRRRIDDD